LPSWAGDRCVHPPQQAITKSLIDEIVPQQLPASVMQRVQQPRRPPDGGHQRPAAAPVLCGRERLSADSVAPDSRAGLDLSILHGQIDEIQEQTFGSLAVYASGEAAKIDRPSATCAPAVWWCRWCPWRRR
jgi:D-methionine transport system ATP-binding protein